MSQTCFCPEEAAYCKSLVDVWVWSHDEAMHMPEPGCQRLVDAEETLKQSRRPKPQDSGPFDADGNWLGWLDEDDDLPF